MKVNGKGSKGKLLKKESTLKISTSLILLARLHAVGGIRGSFIF